MLDRSKAPDIQPLSKTIFPKPNINYSKNNIPIITTILGDQEVFKLELIIKNNFESDTLIRQLADKLLKKGTKNKNAEKIASEFEFYGAFWGIETYLDFSQIYIYALSKFFRPLTDLCLEILLENEYPQSELDQLINIQKEKSKLNWEKDDYASGQLFRELIFQNDPYGKIIRPEDYSYVEKTETITYYNRNWKNKISQVFVSGNINEKDLDYLFTQLKDFENPNEKLANIPVLFNRNEKNYVEKKDALQTSIRLGFEFIGRNHPDYAKAYLANFILGGYFGSRLQKNIREEKGFTYGIHSQIVNMARGTYFIIGTSVNKKNQEETLIEINKEIEILKNELVTYDEFETVKNYLLGNFQGEINSPFDIVEKIKVIHQNNLDSNYYENFQESLINCSQEDIQFAINEYFNPEKAIIQLVG